MSLKESSANMLVRFAGMGIINFDEDRGTGEISVIRDQKHVFSVRIQKPVFKDGIERDLVIYEDVEVFESIPKEGVEIEIEGIGSAVEGYEIYQSEAGFDRQKSEDTNDFRWIVDMDAMHGEGLSDPGDEERHPVTSVSISGGIFYTHRLNTDLSFEKVTKNSDGGEVEREYYGHVAETIGVAIEAKQVRFTLKMGGKSVSHEFEARGIPYRIEINNIDDSEDSLISDMPDYYKYLAPATGTRFEFDPVKENDDAGGGSVNALTFCHPVKGGGG